MPYYVTDDGKECVEFNYEPGTGWRKVTVAEGRRIQRELAREALLEFLKPGMGVYTVLVKSGQATQHHRLLVPRIAEDGKPYIQDITWLVARAAGFRRDDKSGGIVQGGYGYSKAFQAVYSLGASLWPDGTPEPHGVRNGEPDSSGGYALRQL